jgi:hypothetical protein
MAVNALILDSLLFPNHMLFEFYIVWLYIKVS